MILVVDFGSQTTHLISRRIEELGVKTSIVNPANAISFLKKHKCRGIILSGGPASVYGKSSPKVDNRILDFGLPILGICYGQQLICQILNGKVKSGKKREFGPAQIKKVKDSPLLISLPDKFAVWMSHGDEVSKLPANFKTLCKTENTKFAAIANEKMKIYGLQFHPEVIHTQFGDTILENFIEICGLDTKKNEVDKKEVGFLIKDIKDSVGREKAICALSGGVDSSVAALLVYKAVGKNLRSVYIDSGLMRQDETKELRKIFIDKYHMKVKVVHAKKVFLRKLKGIVDPEKKRIIIGETFIEVLEKEAKLFGAEFLVQGTIYPDVIESAGTKHSKKIKSHHNVAGLPKKMKLTLIEPLRSFYKDEVRKIGKILKIPSEVVKRQPFPGPGLAIRTIGEVTEPKLKILRKSDLIIQDEINKSKLNSKLWQIFAVFTGIKTTGVRGDNRAYGETIAIRAIEAKDAMSAHWSRLPYDFLDKISSRIVNEVKQVNRVVYDITNKPPATMEWE